MGMANPIPINRTLVANFAARHEGNLPYEIEAKYNTRPCRADGVKMGAKGIPNHPDCSGMPFVPHLDAVLICRGPLC